MILALDGVSFNFVALEKIGLLNCAFFFVLLFRADLCRFFDLDVCTCSLC